MSSTINAQRIVPHVATSIVAMLRLACVGFFVAALMTSPVSAQIAPDQTELSSAVMDRWLAVQKSIVARSKTDRAAGKTRSASEDEVFLTEVCGKAGFAGRMNAAPPWPMSVSL